MGNGNIARSAHNTEGNEKSSISEIRFEAVVLVRTFDSCEPTSKYSAVSFFKITNTMSLVDYPLFSWVVVIHSLHVSSF